MSFFAVVEKTIPELRAALDAGVVTSVELVAQYLDRIAHYDRHGLTLNAVPVLNPDIFTEARAADERREQGQILSPLDGIPYTAKDSYKVKGLTVASGSPAFKDLIATEDAFSIAQLRKAGAILIGLTNMPPMANGGMQRGYYGRAESPYNLDYLTAAFGSGSSNGSGTATGASFAAFGLGEETWSSGRAPASNNGLCAYTPSRGVISTRGNWPLVPTMDVVVPHTRTMDDMLMLLEEVVADDEHTRGDFWRVQPWVATLPSSQLRPGSYHDLKDPQALVGKRIAVPKMYINEDIESSDRIHTRPSIIALWELARAELQEMGAEVVETDFPVVTNYESHGKDAKNLVARGLVPQDFAEYELFDLSMWAWNDFLQANNDPHLNSLTQVDPSLIFPVPEGSEPGRYDDHLHRFAPEDVDLQEYVYRARKDGIAPLEAIPTIEKGIRGLEQARKIDLEDWMDDHGFDAVVFPAVADVGPADADTNPVSADLAWKNGVWVANGNLVPRHLGIPTVTTPMGIMSDIGMPVGLTFAGKGYDDNALLAYAWAFDDYRSRREAAPLTPELNAPLWCGTPGSSNTTPSLTVKAHTGKALHDLIPINIVIHTNASEVAVSVNGHYLTAEKTSDGFVASTEVPAAEHERIHSTWRKPYGSIVTVLAREGQNVVGTFVVVGGIS